jgi:hypothetical protein
MGIVKGVSDLFYKIGAIGVSTQKTNKYRKILMLYIIRHQNKAKIVSLLVFCQQMLKLHKSELEKTKVKEFAKDIAFISRLVNSKNPITYEQIKSLCTCFDANHRIPIGIIKECGLTNLMKEFLIRYNISNPENPKLMEYTTPYFNQKSHTKLWYDAIANYGYIIGGNVEKTNKKNLKNSNIKTVEDFAKIVALVENHPTYISELEESKIFRPHDAIKFNPNGKLPNPILKFIEGVGKFTFNTNTISQRDGLPYNLT